MPIIGITILLIAVLFIVISIIWELVEGWKCTKIDWGWWNK